MHRCARHKCFFLPENADEFPFEEYDYIVDAVDTVTAKITLIMKAEEKHVPVISSMGAGNKLDASAFRVADIYKTKVCPLARVMLPRIKEAWDQKAESRIFRGETYKTNGRYGDQLP